MVQTQVNIRGNIEDLEYGKSSIPKPMLRPECGILFEHQGFLMQQLHGIVGSLTATRL